MSKELKKGVNTDLEPMLIPTSSEIMPNLLIRVIGFDESEAPTLSRNLLDEAGLWHDKNKEEMQKVNKDMMEFGMSCYKKDKDGNVTRINPLSDEANDLWNK